MNVTAPRILMVGSELFPWVKTGGLADVMAALPMTLIDHGLDVRVLMPAYPALLEHLQDIQPLCTLPNPWQIDATLHCGRNERGLMIYVIDAPSLYQRSGSPYQQADGQDWPDNLQRFALLGYIAAHFHTLDLDFVPQVVHGHDWHAGMMPVWLKQLPHTATRPASVMTIHNLAYAGSFPLERWAETQLSPSLANTDGLEFYGQLSFLKGGLQFADALTTVSPNYARQICQPEHGMGFDGLLRYRANQLHGILNGMDNQEWGPTTGKGDVAYYNADQPNAKQHARAFLQQREGLAIDPHALICIVVSRLAYQKGLDLILNCLEQLMQLPIQLVVLGQGDRALTERFQKAATRWPSRVAVRIGYQEDWAHQTFAGGDVFLMPSRHEPCGLTQLYALRYGTLPLVHPVGGLVDTVSPIALHQADIHAEHCPVGTGFYLADWSEQACIDQMNMVCTWFRQRPDCWASWRQQAMSRCFDWSHAAHAYQQLYHDLIHDQATQPISTNTDNTNTSHPAFV